MRFDNQNKIIRILLLIPIWGWITSGVYRVYKYNEDKSKKLNLIIGILCLVPSVCVGFIFAACDLVTTVADDKIYLLVE
ncbi:MAG: hypothetical protein SOV26_04160 [Candidatus Onthovivens sp.]|nr:hypothetical protein [Candidatus Onthovivens sp.]